MVPLEGFAHDSMMISSQLFSEGVLQGEVEHSSQNGESEVQLNMSRSSLFGECNQDDHEWDQIYLEEAQNNGSTMRNSLRSVFVVQSQVVKLGKLHPEFSSIKLCNELHKVLVSHEVQRVSPKEDGRVSKEANENMSIYHESVREGNFLWVIGKSLGVSCMVPEEVIV
ncbi:hypothetical protein VNO78_34922 [Psophocarpus tetragonolobus]|uniref:Uncharacterized protein n=1 Tax=Psophocarpus tetragonolobus TaxID=3891 RepID=A0AAN9RH22_PSOTE